MRYSPKVLSFLIVGVVNTLIGLAAIFMAKGFLLLNDVSSNAIGYSIGLLVSFILNRSWTFRHKGSVTSAAILFLIVQAVAYSLNLLCVLSLIKLGVNSYAAQSLSVLPYTLVSYVGSVYFVFTPEK